MAVSILYALPGEMVYCQHKELGSKEYIKIFLENNSVILRSDCK